MQGETIMRPKFQYSGFHDFVKKVVDEVAFVANNLYNLKGANIKHDFYKIAKAYEMISPSFVTNINGERATVAIDDKGLLQVSIPNLPQKRVKSIDEDGPKAIPYKAIAQSWIDDMVSEFILLAQEDSSFIIEEALLPRDKETQEVICELIVGQNLKGKILDDGQGILFEVI